MAGTLGAPTPTNIGGNRTAYRAAWTASSTGGVTGSALAATPVGRLWHVKVVPAADVSTAYSVTLLDADGLDLLRGGGAALSSTSGVYLLQCDPPTVLDTTSLTPAISGAGDSKTGSIVIVVGE